MAADSPMGPDLGPSPAEDDVPAFDEMYESTAELPRGKHLHVRLGIVYQRDPEQGETLNRRQAEAIRELLVWARQYQREVDAGTRCPGRKASPTHCVRCQNAEPYRGGRCTRDPAECPCMPFHRKSET
jgi:hypothetical protein